MSNKNGNFEVNELRRWAYFPQNKMKNAKNQIASYTQYSLFKKKDNFLVYIAKIVIYSLFYQTSIETMIEDDPKNWTIGPNRTQGASDYYSIQRVKEKEQIIIATGVKNSKNKPYYLIFSRNRNHNQQPWFFEKITTCTNYINNKPICITDSIKIDDLVKLETINTESIDFDHIFSTKNEEKGIFRFPMKFQKLSYDIRTSRLSEIIENSFNSQKQNIKSTIRYDKEINQIVFCHYLPLDFSDYGGNKYDLYASIREIKGPKPRFEIPTILPYHMVYSQLLEKPKIDHWTYALCKFEENEIKKENQELKKRNQELEEKLK